MVYGYWWRGIRVGIVLEGCRCRDTDGGASVLGYCWRGVGIGILVEGYRCRDISMNGSTL